MLNEFNAEEYNTMFPEQQQYQLWMAAIEADYVEECKHQSGISVPPGKGRFVFAQEDLSPFATVNS
jgi:hypothetical protein